MSPERIVKLDLLGEMCFTKSNTTCLYQATLSDCLRICECVFDKIRE